MDHQNVGAWRWGVALVVVACFVSPTYGMEHYVRAVQDQNGTAIAGATVTVYLTGTATLATIYSANGATVKANPFTTAIDGIADFYAANGVYDLVIYHPRNIFTADKTKGIALYDVRDSASTAFPASPFIGQVVALLQNATSIACEIDASEPTDVINLCGWDGSAWVSVGGGGGGGSSGLDQNFDITGGNTITGSSETKRFELYGTGAQSAKAWVGYVGSDGNFYWTCLDTTVDNCDKNIKLITGKSFQILNNGGTSTFVVTEAGSVSKATIDCSAADVSCTVTRTKEFEFVACQAAVAGHIWNTPAANAPAAACDANNVNTIKGYASFDASTDETIYASMFLPPGYVAGSLGVTFIWKAAATSGAVGLCMRAVRVPDTAVSDAALPAQGAGNCVSDTAKGTTLQENHASIAAVTCTSCVASDELKIAFERDANGSAVTDDMTGDAHVIKAIVSWKELQ